MTRRDKEPLLTIAMYNGEYDGNLDALKQLCVIEGNAVPDGRPPYSPLEEALKLLEVCADRYSTPRPSCDCFTVFIGRKTGIAIRPLARLDVYARNGYASASVLSADSPRTDTESIRYSLDDDALTIMRKILEAEASVK
ncbi:hypothetical protein [Paraburkholderia sp. RL18-085-BIA-A]|jgi:hypothetical protein|uniref:hypothetical protein n=1 Tax=Paraburkholderia sp. RL18-085-BIA-A TaxID=3031633 RepID=UPI0038BA0E9E